MKEREDEPELPFNTPPVPTTPEEGEAKGTDFQERPECSFG